VSKWPSGSAEFTKTALFLSGWCGAGVDALGEAAITFG
jgi:hypothetical protein